MPNIVRDDYSEIEKLRDVTMVLAWWKKLLERINYPLYCIVLASRFDTDAAAFLEKHSAELDEISGADCCFIRFRDMRRAKYLLPFEYFEHARVASCLAWFIGIENREFPCLLFFEQLGVGRHVYISLANLSEQEIMMLISQIFDSIRRSKSSPMKRLRRFGYSQTLNVTEGKLIKNARERGYLSQLLESLLISD